MNRRVLTLLAAAAAAMAPMPSARDLIANGAELGRRAPARRTYAQDSLYGRIAAQEATIARFRRKASRYRGPKFRGRVFGKIERASAALLRLRASLSRLIGGAR